MTSVTYRLATGSSERLPSAQTASGPLQAGGIVAPNAAIPVRRRPRSLISHTVKSKWTYADKTTELSCVVHSRLARKVNSSTTRNISSLYSPVRAYCRLRNLRPGSFISCLCRALYAGHGPKFLSALPDSGAGVIFASENMGVYRDRYKNA